MDRRVLVVSFTVWVILLAVGGKWVANPMLHPPRAELRDITAEDTIKAFPWRLAGLQSSEPGIASYARQLEDDDNPRPASTFDYQGWAFREARSRLLIFFFVWMAGGILLHWVLARIFNDSPKRAPAMN